MNKSDLIAKMTQRFSGDRGAAAAAVNGVLEEIEGSLVRGERVSLTGFGTFDRRERAPRTARNPRTGEAILVGPTVVPVFRAGTAFRTLLAQSDGEARLSAPAAVERSAPKAKEAKSSAAASTSPGEAVAVPADVALDGKKRSGKKARVQPAGKGGKSARKAAKSKAGKKAAKGAR